MISSSEVKYILERNLIFVGRHIKKNKTIGYKSIIQ